MIQQGLVTGGTVILGAICYQIATKTWQVGSGLNRGGSAPSLSRKSQMREIPLTAGTSRVATSEARFRSPQAGALPHFPPMCTTAQIRSVPQPSFPKCRFRESQRSTPAILQDCHSERVQPAPELRPRWQDHRCYTVRPTQPFPSILQIRFPSCWLPALPLGSYTWETEPFRCRRHLAIPGDGFMRTRVCQTESVPMPPCKCAQRGPPTLSSQRYSHVAPMVSAVYW